MLSLFTLFSLFMQSWDLSWPSLGKVKNALETGVELVSKMWGECVDGWTVMTTRTPTRAQNQKGLWWKISVIRMRALIMCSLSPYSPPLLFLLYFLSCPISLFSFCLTCSPVPAEFCVSLVSKRIPYPFFSDHPLGNSIQYKIPLYFETLQPFQGPIKYE